MSGAFPISTAKFGTLGIKSIQNTIISKTVSGKKLARQIDNQRWAFTVQIITGNRSDVYGDLMAFIVKQRSGKENFTIIPPEIEDARFKAGDFIKFASHTKVYMVVSDVTSSSGGATVTIEPPLLIALTDDSVVTYDNVPFTVYLTSDIQEFGVNGADKDGTLYYEYQFDVEEAL